jgi:thiol-disulfide isomerase/thioredoxin
VCLLVLAVLLAGPSKASAKEEKWTKQQAVEDFQSFVDDRSATGDVLRENVAGWTKKIDETGLDLQEEKYLLSLGRYITAAGKPDPKKEQDAALKELADFIVEKNSLPESAKTFAKFISETMSWAASQAIKEDDLKRAKKLLRVSTDLSGNPDTIYAYMGLQLLETEKPDAHKFLAYFLGEAMTSTKLSVRQKHKIMAFIYSDRNEKLKQKQGQAEAAKFVPFKGVDLEGKKISVADYKGKVLLVDFWASWCGPCIMDMPNVVAAYKKYKDKGFEILGVSLDHPDSEDKVRSTMKRLEMTWPVIYEGKYWEATPAVMNGVHSIPMTYLLDRQGKPRYTRVYGKELEKAIEELLAEKPVQESKKRTNATPAKK